MIASLGVEERRHYDYDLLEEKYMENQNRLVDDEDAKRTIKHRINGRTVLLVAPGKSSIKEFDKIKRYTRAENAFVIGVNAILPEYADIYDAIFFTNSIRYNYAQEAYADIFIKVPKILLSNIKTEPLQDELIFKFNLAVKRGWEHFDNAVICVLRLLDRLDVKKVALAGFDGFKHEYNESYADASLPTLNPDGKWDELNEEIKDMFRDVKETTVGKMDIGFVTESIYNG